MKHCTAPALLLAIIVVLLVGRYVFVAAQAPDGVPPPAALPPALPTPSITTPPPGAPVYVQPLAPPVAGPKDPTAASLMELVQLLREVRQRKADLQQQEEKLITVIRQRIEQEKKVHEEVLQMLDAPKGGESPKNNGSRDLDPNADVVRPK